jgi:hypothetical protein
LGLQALFDMFGRPTAGQEALVLRGNGAGDTDRRIQLGFGFSLEQERDHNHSQRTTLHAPILDLNAPKRPDAWVEDAFEPLPGGGVSKYAPGQFIASQPAIRPNDVSAECLPDFSEGRLAWLNHLTRQVVGIHHSSTALAEQLGGGGLAHADTAG